VYSQGHVYARDTSGYILDAQSGSLVASFPDGTAPAFGGTLGYTVTGAGLVAFDPSGGTQQWAFAGDGTLTSAPLVVGQDVYVGAASGNLYAVDRSSGALAWSANVGAAIPAPDERNVSQPLTGLNAGDGLLVVPAGNTLVAYAGS
jgi:outer membrane protein assembly factor BamB